MNNDAISLKVQGDYYPEWDLLRHLCVLYRSNLAVNLGFFYDFERSQDDQEPSTIHFCAAFFRVPMELIRCPALNVYYQNYLCYQLIVDQRNWTWNAW